MLNWNRLLPPSQRIMTRRAHVGEVHRQPHQQRSVTAEVWSTARSSSISKLRPVGPDARFEVAPFDSSGGTTEGSHGPSPRKEWQERCRNSVRQRCDALRGRIGGIGVDPYAEGVTLRSPGSQATRRSRDCLRTLGSIPSENTYAEGVPQESTCRRGDCLTPSAYSVLNGPFPRVALRREAALLTLGCGM
jgi:hypothetical protein